MDFTIWNGSYFEVWPHQEKPIRLSPVVYGNDTVAIDSCHSYGLCGQDPAEYHTHWEVEIFGVVFVELRVKYPPGIPNYRYTEGIYLCPQCKNPLKPTPGWWLCRGRTYWGCPHDPDGTLVDHPDLKIRSHYFEYVVQAAHEVATHYGK